MPEDCPGLSVVFDLTVEYMDAAGQYKVLVNEMKVVGERKKHHTGRNCLPKTYPLKGYKCAKISGQFPVRSS